METKTLPRSKAAWGDAAVDGLLAGIVAGIIMAGFLLVATMAGGRSAAWLLQQFDPGQPPTPLAGAVTHLAVSAFYGLVFGALWRALAGTRRWLPAWLAGLAFGLLLWLLAFSVVSASALDRAGWLRSIPPAELAAAHLVYGLSLGWLAGRLQRR